MTRLRLHAFTAALLLGSVSACGQQVPPKLRDQSIRELHNGLPGMTQECLRKVRSGGLVAMPTRVDECFQMLPVQRWRGLWRDDFEGSQFCPNPARNCSFEESGDRIWLSFNDSVRLKGTRPAGGLYAIEFVGRRTLRRGSYGHMGVFQHEVLVDRLISMKLAEDDPQ